MSTRLLLAFLFVILLPNASECKAIKALVTPITKHGSLFSLSLHTHPNRSFVIDLSTPVSWLKCPPRNIPSHPVLCGTSICFAAQSSSSCPAAPVSRPTTTPRGFLPCMCTTSITNPIPHSNQTTTDCTSNLLAYTTLSLPSTDGHNPLSEVKLPRIAMGCAPTSFLPSLPHGTSGLATLSRSPLSVPSQFSASSYKLRKQFAICLPSTENDPGVAFFGSEPYYLLPPPGRNATAFLQFTPLIKPSSNSSFGYYIGVKGIAINGQAVRLPAHALRGGVQLSTVTPFTTMRTNVYRAFLKQYMWATRGIPRVKKVAPFDLCLNTSQLGSTRVGLPVAQVDLQLNTGGANWTMFGANTFNQVKDDVACLAFVDGGKKATPAVVIGSFQIQDNFLLFDLERSRLGFSSVLYFFQTTCGNFNFTSGV